MSTPVNTLGDLKEALSSGRKADITHVRVAFQNYVSRPCEYGDRDQGGKYVRANFRRPTGGEHHTVPTAEDFRRFRAYLRAAASHLAEVFDAMELHLALDPDLQDVEGMRRAAYAVDTDTKPGDKVGPSLLPHIAPACSSLMMAITQAVDCGLLPRDPGQPWRDPTAHERLVGPRQEKVDVNPAMVERLRARMSAQWKTAEPVQGGVSADLCPGESDLLAEESSTGCIETLQASGAV